MIQIRNSKQAIRYHLCKTAQSLSGKDKCSDSIQRGECFGHWILKFEIYLKFGAWDLGFMGSFLASFHQNFVVSQRMLQDNNPSDRI